MSVAKKLLVVAWLGMSVPGVLPNGAARAADLSIATGNSATINSNADYDTLYLGRDQGPGVATLTVQDATLNFAGSVHIGSDANFAPWDGGNNNPWGGTTALNVLGTARLNVNGGNMTLGAYNNDAGLGAVGTAVTLDPTAQINMTGPSIYSGDWGPGLSVIAGTYTFDFANAAADGKFSLPANANLAIGNRVSSATVSPVLNMGAGTNATFNQLRMAWDDQSTNATAALSLAAGATATFASDAYVGNQGNANINLAAGSTLNFNQSAVFGNWDQRSTVVRGAGQVNVAATLVNNGRFVADGGHLQLAFGTLDRWTSGAMGDGTRAGWYASGGGKLSLPALSVSSGTTALNLGEKSSAGALDANSLVNSVRMASMSVSSPGTLGLALLATDHAGVMTGLVDAVGVWSFDPQGALSIDSTTMDFRYDAVAAYNVLNPGGFGESDLQLFENSGSGWAAINAGPADTVNHILSGLGTGIASSEVQFAVARTILMPSRTWTGGSSVDNNFSSGDNWGGTPPADKEVLHFAGAARTAPHNDFVGAVYGGIAFDAVAAAFTVGGNAITLSGTITNSSANDQVINLPMAVTYSSTVIDTGPKNVTLGGNVSGPGGIKKVGVGTLYLAGADNGYLGQTKVTAGTVQVNGALSGGGAVTVTGGSLQLNGAVAAGAAIAVPGGATLGIGPAAGVARDVHVGGGTVNLAGTLPAGTTLTLSGGTVNTVGGGATAAAVSLPTAGSGPVLNAPAGQELTVTNTLTQTLADGSVTVTAGATPFKVGGTNVNANIDKLVLQGGTTRIDQIVGNRSPGLDVRGWQGLSHVIEGSTFDMPGAPTHSTHANTLGYATESIDMNGNNQEHFGDNTRSGVPNASPLRPSGYAENYTVEYRGKLYVPTTGTYRFATTSDDGSALWIGAEVGGDVSTANPNYSAAGVQNAWDHGMEQRSSGQYSLTGGQYYDLVARFWEAGGGNGIQVQWDPVGGTSFVAIPGDNFFHGSEGPGGINLPSTDVAVTAGSALNLNYAAAAVLGNLNLAAGTVTFQTATSVSFNNIAATGTGAIAAGVPLALRNGDVSVAGGQVLTVNAAVIDGASPTPVNKIGGGTLLLAGANAHSGATAVAAGKVLLAQGGSMGATAVSVTGSGTYGTSYASSGNTIAGGSTLGLAAGAALDLRDGQYNTLAFTGAATVDAANLSFDLGTALGQNDKVTLVGASALGGVIAINLNALGGLANGQYTLVTSDGGGLDSGYTFAASSGTLAGHTWTLGSTANDIYVSIGGGSGAPLPALAITAPAAAARAMTNTTVPLSGQVSTTEADFNGWTLSDNGGQMAVSGFSPGGGNTAVGAPTGYTASVATGATTGLRSFRVRVSDGANSATAESSLTVLDNRVVTADSVNLGLVHAGANLSGSTYASTLRTSGDDSNATRVTVNGTLFNAAGVTSAIAPAGPASVAAGGTMSTTYAVATAENGGAGLNGEGAYAAVTVPYTASAFSGTASYTGASGGNWSAHANWTDGGGVHAAPGTFAGFDNVDTANIGSGNSVAVNAAASVKNLNLSGAGSTLSGGGTLTLKADAGNAAIAVAAGTHAITAPLALASNTDITVTGSGDQLALGATSGAGSLNKAGAGKAILGGGNFATGHSGGTNVSGGTLQLDSADALRGGSSLTLTGSGKAALGGATSVNLGNAVKLADLNINSHATSGLTASLDVNKSKLIVDKTQVSVATIRSQIKSAYAAARWTGAGITSAAAAADYAANAGGAKTGVGYLDNAIPSAQGGGKTTWQGRSVDSNSVLVRFTYYGDCNLDGAVNLGDFGVFKLNYGTGTQWYQGDFDYSGVVNLGDFGKLKQAYGSTAIAAGEAVPEPATIPLLAMGGLALALRVLRRRRE